MAHIEDRAAIKALLVDVFAVRLAASLTRFKMPADDVMASCRTHVEAQAELVLSNYEKELSVEQIANSVVDRVGSSLQRRSRVFAILEIGSNILAALIGCMAGYFAIAFDTQSAPTIKIVFFVIFGTLVIQFIGNLYFRHFDKAKR